MYILHEHANYGRLFLISCKIISNKNNNHDNETRKDIQRAKTYMMFQLCM